MSDYYIAQHVLSTSAGSDVQELSARPSSCGLRLKQCMADSPNFKMAYMMRVCIFVRCVLTQNGNAGREHRRSNGHARQCKGVLLCNALGILYLAHWTDNPRLMPSRWSRALEMITWGACIVLRHGLTQNDNTGREHRHSNGDPC